MSQHSDNQGAVPTPAPAPVPAAAPLTTAGPMPAPAPAAAPMSTPPAPPTPTSQPATATTEVLNWDFDLDDEGDTASPPIENLLKGKAGRRKGIRRPTLGSKKPQDEGEVVKRTRINHLPLRPALGGVLIVSALLSAGTFLFKGRSDTTAVPLPGQAPIPATAQHTTAGATTPPRPGTPAKPSGSSPQVPPGMVTSSGALRSDDGANFNTPEVSVNGARMTDELREALVKPDPTLSQAFQGSTSGTSDRSATNARNGTGTGSASSSMRRMEQQATQALTTSSATSSSTKAPVITVTNNSPKPTYIPISTTQTTPARQTQPAATATTPLPEPPPPAAPIVPSVRGYVPPPSPMQQPLTTVVTTPTTMKVSTPPPAAQPLGSTATTAPSTAPSTSQVKLTPAGEASSSAARSTPITYLGSSNNDSTTVAVVQVGTHEEVVQEGELIPGTKTQLLKITPTHITIRYSGQKELAEIPLQESQP